MVQTAVSIQVVSVGLGLLSWLIALGADTQWDGLFPAGLPDPAALAELTSQIREARPGSEPFDVIADIPAGEDPVPRARAGATWTVTDLGLQPTLAQVREVIEAGPHAGA